MPADRGIILGNDIGGAMTISDDIRKLIDSGPLAHLTTLNADGSPQVSVVWVGIQGDEFVCAHMGAWQKVKNIRRDPRVALSLLGQGRNPMGLQEYLVVYGEARISEGGAAPLLQRLAHIYLGAGVEFPPEPLRSRPGYVTHISAQRFAGVGPWSPGQG
jgi:PPOX class probable F420-dependent enzyme